MNIRNRIPKHTRPHLLLICQEQNIRVPWWVPKSMIRDIILSRYRLPGYPTIPEFNLAFLLLRVSESVQDFFAMVARRPDWIA